MWFLLEFFYLINFLSSVWIWVNLGFSYCFERNCSIVLVSWFLLFCQHFYRVKLYVGHLFAPAARTIYASSSLITQSSSLYFYLSPSLCLSLPHTISIRLKCLCLILNCSETVLFTTICIYCCIHRFNCWTTLGQRPAAINISFLATSFPPLASHDHFRLHVSIAGLYRVILSRSGSLL